MFARAVLGVALLFAAGALALDMSGKAPRGAGSDHVSPAVFAASVPGGSTLCQTVPPLPGDVASTQLLIGTYHHPVPTLALRYLDTSGAVTATGTLAAGTHEGTVTIALHTLTGGHPAARACLRVGGHTNVVLGGEGGPIGGNSELIDGHPQPGRVSLIYMRAGAESWWSLLPTLDRRFGVGKAAIFGDWTLPAMALALFGVWVAATRLLLRELG
ncbi:MAG TPA: hypothetical protein VID29_06360 [Solirubrobacteraceae bacterium]